MEEMTKMMKSGPKSMKNWVQKRWKNPKNVKMVTPIVIPSKWSKKGQKGRKNPNFVFVAHGGIPAEVKFGANYGVFIFGSEKCVFLGGLCGN